MSHLSAATPFTLASLYQAHHGWLTTWLTGKLQSAFDADDVTQDTFLRVMGSESLPAIRDPKSFLCTIARRVMIDLFRRNALERAWLEMLAQLPQAMVPSPELQHIQLETLQQVGLGWPEPESPRGLFIFATGGADVCRDCRTPDGLGQLSEKICCQGN